MIDDKESLLVRISTPLRIKLNDYIAKTYSKPYGALSYVVEQALWIYIDAKNSHDTQIHKNLEEKKLPTYLKKCVAICSDLIQRGFLLQFTSKELDRSIENMAGHDYRTKRKWRRLLEKYGFVRWKSSAVLEFGDNESLPKLSTIPYLEPEIPDLAVRKEGSQ